MGRVTGGLDYGVMVEWGKVHELVANRVSIVNQIHGCRYDNGSGNPCRMWYHKGRYRVEYCGTEVAAYGLYDLAAARDALRLLDVLDNALWDARRMGYMVLSPVAAHG